MGKYNAEKQRKYYRQNRERIREIQNAYERKARAAMKLEQKADGPICPDDEGRARWLKEQGYPMGDMSFWKED